MKSLTIPKALRSAALLAVLLGFSATAFGEVSVSVDEATSVKTDGLNVTASLPFDEEYKITLSNEDQRRRALVKIRIDGREVAAKGLILRKGERVSLERFLDSGTLSKGNKFKFVEKAELKSRKENAEDGLIFVTVQYERAPPEPAVRYRSSGSGRVLLYNSDGSATWTPGTEILGVPRYGTSPTDTWDRWIPTPLTSGNALNLSSSAHDATTPTTTASNTSPGVTVEGSESKQRFQHDSVKDLEDQIDTLVIWLSGFYKNPPLTLNK